VGTTDTDFSGDPETLAVKTEEVEYLLEGVARYFPKLGWKKENIRGSYAGLRTLKGRSGRSPSHVTREWELVEPFPGLLMPVGGKLTSARVEAVFTVDRVCRMLKKEPGISPTQTRPFPWAPAQNFKEWSRLNQKAGESAGLDSETAEWSVRRFGTSVMALHKILKESPEKSERIVPEWPFCLGEITLAVQNEMARTLEDLFRRRIPLLLLTTVHRETVSAAAEEMGTILSWDSKKRGKAVEDFLEQYGKN